MIRAGITLLLLSSFTLMQAQPIPKLTSVFPEWIQRGTTIEITLSGENLTNATRLVFSSDTESNQAGIAVTELTAKDNKTLAAKLAVSSSLPPGERELRVVTPTGVTEPIAINLSELPELHESGTNKSPESSQLIELPAAINGFIKAPAESDYYRFHAKKGEPLIFDVFASRMNSPLDSSLAVQNLEGKELARNEDANGLDSLIIFRPPEGGDYLLQLRDFRYQGGADFKYRIYAGAIPYLDSIFPLGGRRGQSVEVELQGHNLASLTITNKIDPNTQLGVAEIRAQGTNLLSNPRAFEIGGLPESIETEPNDTAETATEVTVPVTINGRIGSPKDVDVFKFKSDKDQRLICEVYAQRLGSRLDALLTLTDAKGKMLAQNDDVAGMDARIEFDFAKEQEYRLSIRDLNERGGSKFAYRLSIHQPEADFLVKFFPDIPRLTRSGHATVRCEVTRTGGFPGAVRVAFDGLPSGVYSEPLVLTAETPSSGLLVISAAADAALGSFPVQIRAGGVVNGKMINHLAEPVIPDQKSRKVKRGSRSTEDQVVNDAHLTVLDTPPFVLDLLSLKAEADQDQGASIQLRAQRMNDFTNDIELAAEGFSADREPLSKNFDVPAVTLKADQSRGKLILNAKPSAETGTRTVVIKGTAVVNGQTNIQYTQTIPLTINQIPFALASSLPRLSVAALPPGSKSAAGEAVFSVKAERRAGFKGEIALSVEGLPDGVVAAFDKIAANQDEANVKITASAKAPVGKEISFTFLGVGMFNDRNYKHRTTPIKLTVTASEEVLSSANK